MKINTGSTVSLTTFRLRKVVRETKIPIFVQERIEYFAEYLSRGMTFSATTNKYKFQFIVFR